MTRLPDAAVGNEGFTIDLDLVERTTDFARVQCLGELRADEAFHGGPVLGTSPDERRLRHTRNRTPVDGFDDGAEYWRRLRGEWAYGGFVYPHFGHCMAELVHRILPSRVRHPGCAFVFCGFPGSEPVTGFEGLPDFMQAALTYLEVRPEEVRVLHQHTIVDRLHVVEQGADLGGYPKPGYLELLRAFGEPRLKRLTEGLADDPVYVSRSKLPWGGGFLGERFLEQILASHGFTVIHPEELSFSEQIAKYVSASILLFAEGSACHGVELLGHNVLKRCFLLVRRPEVGVAFERVLGPRSQSYEAHFGTVWLADIVANPADGTPLRHYGVAGYDLPSLGAFLDERFGIPSDSLDPAAYRSAALRDWEAHMAYHRANSPLLPEADVQAADAFVRRWLSGA